MRRLIMSGSTLTPKSMTLLDVPYMTTRQRVFLSWSQTLVMDELRFIQRRVILRLIGVRPLI
ncbi:hypothetical protein NA8A_23337 [Nitratireductor indicus C115]|uniref:Uncharacterized protein n=1 Tax=Nitratireductor indicus C115 TaxID=1231190 RepID=K2MXH4_9HYPH|nr:hypothetical protein NA8A_23337 [Nitratireductor indicus C115]